MLHRRDQMQVFDGVRRRAEGAGRAVKYLVRARGLRDPVKRTGIFRIGAMKRSMREQALSRQYLNNGMKTGSKFRARQDLFGVAPLRVGVGPETDNQPQQQGRGDQTDGKQAIADRQRVWVWYGKSKSLV